MTKNKPSTSLCIPWRFFFFTMIYMVVIVVGKEATHAKEDMYPGRKGQYQYQQPSEAQDQLNQPHMKQSSRRIRRNAPDNLQSLLDRSTAFARIINGVSLQSGILSGTLKIDVVVQELLNFGSIKMPEVVGFKADQITALTSAFTDFKKVKTGNEVEDQEKIFVELEKIMEESKGAKSLEISNGTYFSVVENFGKNFDITNMKDIVKLVEDALKFVAELEKIPT